MSSSRRCSCMGNMHVSKAVIAFLGFTLLETVVDIAIVTVLLLTYEDGVLKTVLKRDEKSVLPVYLGLFVLAHLYQLGLAIDAIIAKNTIQVLGLCIFNTLFLVYSIIQILEIRSLVAQGSLSILVWVIPVVIAITEVAYLWTSYWIYREFGWQIYKRIGADRTIKKIYKWYQVFVCLLKFDYFLFISFALQLVLLVLEQDSWERWVTVGAMPVILVILVIGYFGVRLERKSLVYVFLIGCTIGAAFFVFKLFRIYHLRTTDYALVFKSLTVFSALCLSALLLTCSVGLVCLRNFGRGLLFHMREQKVARTECTETNTGPWTLDSAKSRMSID